MKKSKYFNLFGTIIAVVALFANTSTAQMGSSNDNIDYLVGSSDLGRAYIGAYLREADRQVGIHNDSRDFNYRDQSEYVYAGYYISRWSSLYLTLANADIEIDDQSSDSAMRFGFGITFDLLDHEIKDMNLLEDRIRANGVIEYTVIDDITAFSNESAKIEEYMAYIKFSLVNDVHRNILFTPESIGIYVGPVYSYLDSTTLEARDTMGFMYGLDIYFTKKVYTSFGMYNVGEQKIMAGLHLRL